MLSIGIKVKIDIGKRFHETVGNGYVFGDGMLESR